MIATTAQIMMVGNPPRFGINMFGILDSIAPKDTPFVAYVTSPKIISMFAMVEMNGCILYFAMKKPAILANTVVSMIHATSAIMALPATGIPVKSKICPNTPPVFTPLCMMIVAVTIPIPTIRPMERSVPVNRIRPAFQHKRNGEILAGVYEEGTHRVLSVDDCKIENRLAQEIVETIRGLLRSFKITVYNEDSGYGLLRHVMVRTGHATGEVMVVLVTASPIFPSKKNFAKALVKAHPQITTIVQNINDKDTSMVLGERNQVLYGRGFIEDKLCGKTFKISPTSFYQVNPVQTELLYNKAMEYANLTGEEVVVDAYCGTGTIGIVTSDHAKQVIGVELNKAAAKDAITNVKRNDCKNVRIYDGDAGKFMVGMAEAGTDVDVVFLDPPRSGSTPEFFDSVCKLAPKQIVYISCGPESLARDLKYLKSKRMYQVEKIALVDLFPWTEHCEAVCLLSRERSS